MSLPRQYEKIDDNEVILLCKKEAWCQSVVVSHLRHDQTIPQVAYVSTIASELKQYHYTVFMAIGKRYGSLPSFLKAYTNQVNDKIPLGFMNQCRFLLIPYQDYQQDAVLPFGRLPPLTKNSIARINDTYFVLFPPNNEPEMPLVSLSTTSTLHSGSTAIMKTAITGAVTSTEATTTETTTTEATTTEATTTEATTTEATTTEAATTETAVTVIDAANTNTTTLPEQKELIPINTLSQELYFFAEAHTISKHVLQQRRNIFKKISKMLQHNWPKERLRLELFGSSANGLGFDDSDLDLSIVVPEEHYKNDLINMYQLANQSTFYNMRYLGDSLRRIGMKNVKPIKRATVPICKFQDAQSGIHCDINSSNILGIENSKLIKAYTLLDKRVRPFLLAVKQLVKTRNINEASKGTLSSYTYVLMALWYLVQCDPPVIPNLQCISQKCRSTLCSSKLSTSKLTVFQQKIIECDVTYHSCVRVVHKNRPDYEMKPVVNASLIPRKETLWMCHNVQDVGDILKGFLHYFGYEYDYGQYALSLYRGQLVPKGTWSSAHFAVQDPFILGRNVAATTTLIGFNAIKNEFKRAYDLLSSHSSFQDICVSPDYSLFDPDTIEQRILRRNRVKNVDKKAHENDIIEQQKEPKNKTKPQLHAKEFIPLNRLTAANTEYKTVDDLPVSAQEFNESEENIKPFAISISSSAITSVDQKTNPPKTTKVLESTVETVSVTLEPIQPSLPDVLPTPEPIQPSEPIQPPEPMQQRPSSSSPVLKKNKANSQSQLTYAQKVMQALFKSENQKTAPSLSSKIPNGNVSNSTSSSVFRTTKTPVKAPSVPVNTSPTPVPETSNKLKNVKEKEKESIQVKTPTDSPVPVKILPLLAPPSSPLPSTSLTTKNSSEKKKKKKKKKSVKQETEPVISKQEELLDLSGVMDYPSTPRISTFKITTEEETQEETREEETQEETREETQEEETEASSLQENSHNSPHSKTQSTMETDIKTLKLLYVPEYIDRLDIIDVLDQYGEVLKLKELDTFQFTAFETYSHWSASILLDKHHQVFPEEIELWDRCITVNSN